MVAINAKTKDRLLKGLKRFQPILLKAKTADINESDTVTIIADMLADIFGYDKYTDITSEFAIKKTFCDLAIKLDGSIQLLIECKAIGLNLKDDFVRQATNYAADSGTEWTVLTNGIDWKVYKVIFSKPIEKELVYEFDITELSGKKQADLEMLYYLSKEAFVKSSKNSLEDLHVQKQILNKYVIGQLIATDTVLDSIRKQLKKMSPELKPLNDELRTLILSEVLKRDVTEGEKTDEAKKKIAKMERASAAAKSKPKVEPKTEG